MYRHMNAHEARWYWIALYQYDLPVAGKESEGDASIDGCGRVSG